MRTGIVKNIFDLRSKFVIIGLTGKTGSGCSTVAEMLGKDCLIDLVPPDKAVCHEGLSSNDDRKYNIVYNYLKANWHKFETIKASDIIMLYALQYSYKEFCEELNKYDIYLHIDQKEFDKLRADACKCLEYLQGRESRHLKYDVNRVDKKQYQEKVDEALYWRNFLFETLKKYVEDLKEKVTAYKKLSAPMQAWGNNIRKYNHAFEKEPSGKVTILGNEGPANLAHVVNHVIKLLRDLNYKDDQKTYVVIDALRNPYEVLYFRERYSAFYLMSISTPTDVRRKNLSKFNEDEIKKLDEVESPKKAPLEESFQRQDVPKCIELSDIHVVTNGTEWIHNDDLKRQLMQFVALILHPGIITPTPEERVMQIAFTAKLNSGCLSRQVGAVVTDEHFSVKAIGWNTVAEGQTPCSLRRLEDLHNQNDLIAFSEYEMRNKDFRGKISKLWNRYTPHFKDINGMNLSYCFKDVYNSIKGEDNQVHTRSLHAEENAFLQIVKYGGNSIRGGYLFTTASPCVLCAKKAYQLGIKKVFYIDLYPDITLSHIFESGINEMRPETEMFKGAIGRAYINLYNPIIPLKDEIETITGVKKNDIKNL